MLDEYTEFTKTVAVYPEANTGKLGEVMYLSLGLAGEAGEVANNVKKLYRDGYTNGRREKIESEIGDVFWYLVRLCDALGVDPEIVIMENMEKLSGRKDRGTLGGSGENR